MFVKKKLLKTTQGKEKVIAYMNHLAKSRDKWIKRNYYYYQELITFLRHSIPEGSSVLEIGCSTAELLNSVKPKKGVGVDISEEMIKIARKKYPQFTFIAKDVEDLSLSDKFDYIIISDTVGYFFDVQKAFQQVRKLCSDDTRVIINFHSYLWLPILSLAEKLGLKMPSQRLNWLNPEDLSNLLNLTGFEIVKSGKRFIFPKSIPLLSTLTNKYISTLPIINKLSLINYIIAKPTITSSTSNPQYSVSIIIPARNEKGNIEQAVKRIPQMGKNTEIIFIEGHSNDGTLEEIKRVCHKYAKKMNISYAKQDGKGKGDAVRKGFEMAKGDILMILDADLTVPPEDLPKFYQTLASGKGEFINGSRLVYPMEEEAMRTLNILGNKFFSVMFTWLLGQRIKDTLCGTKVLFKKHYQKIKANRGYFGEFDPFGDFDLLFGAAKLNLKITELPIRYKAREYGATNISRFKHGFLLLKMVLFALNKIKFI